MSPKVAIVILAAGASTRMGVPKQLLPWGDQNLLNKIIQTSTALKIETHLILGANNRQIKAELSADSYLSTHINPNWDQGLGGSIAFGVQVLMDKALDGILFILGDQPFVSSDYLRNIISKFEKNPASIVASAFHGNLGVPALFSSEYFNALSELTGDSGAKKIMMQHSDKLTSLAAEAYVKDLDTLEEYKAAYKSEFAKE